MFSLAFTCAISALSILDVRAELFQPLESTVESSPGTMYAHAQVTPAPSNPHQDLKRQVASLASNLTVKTCGWVNSMADWPLTCSGHQQCLSQADNFACCERPQTTYTTLQSQAVTSFQECYYWRGCFDSTASASCTNAACSSTAFVCTSESMPYCGTATWTYPWAGSSYIGSYFFCHSQKYTLSVSFGSIVPKVAPSTSIKPGTTQVDGAVRYTSTPSNLAAAATNRISSAGTPTPSATSEATVCIVRSGSLTYGYALSLIVISLVSLWR